jgi:hypothetical protein
MTTISSLESTQLCFVRRQLLREPRDAGAMLMLAAFIELYLRWPVEFSFAREISSGLRRQR